jgi:hypothetical protein
MKIFLKQFKLVMFTWRKIQGIKLIFRGLGIFPFRLKRLLKLPRFYTELRKFILTGGTITRYWPILHEYNAAAGAIGGMYFHQDLLVSQYIYRSNPKRHIDVGSRIDGFVAQVASFREIEILDIRELTESEHENIKFRKADLMLTLPDFQADSVSCLNAIEHFGLGRYSDSIDPTGHLLGFKNLLSLLSPLGTLYISFPIGISNEVHFNAHRVFHPTDIFTWTREPLKLIRFDYVDDEGRLHKNYDLKNSAPRVKFGCGIYTFIKGA